MTKTQFEHQNYFWQDNFYSYAIHITDGGAIYLYQVDGTTLTKRALNNMKIIRLDGTDFDKLIEILIACKHA